METAPRKLYRFVIWLLRAALSEAKGKPILRARRRTPMRLLAYRTLSVVVSLLRPMGLSRLHSYFGALR
jgi:hypothetical protein